MTAGGVIGAAALSGRGESVGETAHDQLSFLRRNSPRDLTVHGQQVPPEGTAYEVDDREDGFWEVDVLTADGATEVTVGPDGTTVDGTADDADDTLDDAGRQALAGAQVTLAEAIVAAVRAADGQLDSAELAEVDGAWWWRVVGDSPDQEDIELRVDPATGEVVASEG